VTEYAQFALELAGDSGRLLRRYLDRGLNRGTVQTKRGHYDLVTAADVAAEELIRRRVAERFPSHVLFGEESAVGKPPQQGLAWVVDPVDGTSNYAHGLPLFVVNLALCREGTPLVAVSHDPMSGRSYWAERGVGAWVRNRGRDHPIHVSGNEELSRCLLGTGFAYERHVNPDHNVPEFLALDSRTQSVRRLGTAALALAWVSAGMLDAYWEAGLKPWDLAAGWLLVEEAGGKVTDYLGDPVSLNSATLLASNGHPRVHGEILDTLASCRVAAGTVRTGRPD
jgi:myo-inositol-1(or 4)-monophosphatase